MMETQKRNVETMWFHFVFIPQFGDTFSKFMKLKIYMCYPHSDAAMVHVPVRFFVCFVSAKKKGTGLV